MPSQCPHCRASVPDGAVVCPSCGVGLTAEPSRGGAMAVLLAFLLPVIATVVILGLLTVVGFEGYRLIRKALPARTPSPVVISQPVPSPTPRRPAVIPPANKPLRADPVAVRPPRTPVVAAKAAAVVMPEAPASASPAPILTGFLPEAGLPGDALFLRGTGMDDVRSVLMISSHGAELTNCVLLYSDAGSVTVRVPDMPTGTDGTVIAAITTGGISVLADRHTGVTPSGTDGRLKDTSVIVNAGDKIHTGDHMVVMAAPGSEVSIGDDCVAFIGDHAKLTGRGKRCKIYYVGPLTVAAGVATEGMISEPSIEVNTGGDAFKITYVRPGPVEVKIPSPQ